MSNTAFITVPPAMSRRGGGVVGQGIGGDRPGQVGGVVGVHHVYVSVADPRLGRSHQSLDRGFATQYPPLMLINLSGTIVATVQLAPYLDSSFRPG
jgi:hypothetical protein